MRGVEERAFSERVFTARTGSVYIAVDFFENCLSYLFLLLEFNGFAFGVFAIF